MLRRSALWSGDPTVKPPFGVAEIDWGHRLSAGLLALYVFNEGGGPPVDLVRGFTATRQGTPRIASTATGLAAQFAATSDYYQLQTDTVLVPTTRCTLAVIRRKTDTTARGALMFGGSSDAARRCSADSPWSNGVISFDFGGVSAPNRISYAWAATTAIERFAFVAGTLGSAIWLNGVLKASQGSAITRTNEGTTFTLNRMGANQGDLQEFSYFALLETEWLRSHVQEWTAEPYAMLRPIVRRRYFVPAAGGAAVTPNVGSAVLAGIAPSRVVGTVLTPITP